MELIKPSSTECEENIIHILKNMDLINQKMKSSPGGSIPFATYAKFQKILASAIMDLSNLKRYIEEETLWFNDFKREKNLRNEQVREDLIDHYFRNKSFDFFFKIFSNFEDAITRILEQLEDPKKIKAFDFVEKIEELKILTMLKEKGDRRFCHFSMHIRNTIHSNGFFKGKDEFFKKILGEGPFIFKNNQPVNFFDWPSFIKWTYELINIFERIIATKPEINDIKDNAMREDIPEYVEPK